MGGDGGKIELNQDIAAALFRKLNQEIADATSCQ
jgi:hypothetical protein